MFHPLPTLHRPPCRRSTLSLKLFPRIPRSKQQFSNNWPNNVPLTQSLQQTRVQSGLLESRPQQLVLKIESLACISWYPFKHLDFPDRQNPVPVMKGVEIITGLQTSDVTLKQTLDLVNKMGKTPSRSVDRPGFLANRLLIPYINEAIICLETVRCQMFSATDRWRAWVKRKTSITS